MLTKNFSKFKNNVAIISANGQKYTYKDLLDFSLRINKFFVKKSLVICLSKNTPEFLLGYISFLHNKHVPIMIDYSIKSDLLDKILLNYNAEFIWVPSQIKNNF